MDIVTILFMVFLSYRNAMRAREKGANAAVFGVLTFILYVVCTLIGIIISFVAVFRNTIGQLDQKRLEAKDQEYSRELARQFAQAIMDNPIHYLAIMMCGMGGYLLANYIINRLPDKNKMQ